MSKRKKNSPPPRFTRSTISVIIPMYNVEKYIGDCLDSLLAQTFRDFELIVVDDCSTDSSREIVESYAPKFGERLTLLRMKKNSGGAGFPRNKGLALSRGEYIYFCDGDDAVTPTALEELYSRAQEFNADVVLCEKYFNVPEERWYDTEYIKQLKPFSWCGGEQIFFPEPMLLGENFEQRMPQLFNDKKKLALNVWNQLIRRDFIVNNEISFRNCFCEDSIFTFCEFCCAKKFVIIPNVIYYYRRHKGSASLANLNVQQLLHRQITSLKVSVEYIDEVLSDYEYFTARPQLKHVLVENIVNYMLSFLVEIYKQIPAHNLDELLKAEFNDTLTAVIFNDLNVRRLQFMQAQQQFNQFAEQAQKRIAELERELARRQ